MNRATDGNISFTPFLTQFQDGLLSALRKLPVDYANQIYRGLGRYHSDIARTWTQGSEVTLNYFVSTSKLEQKARNFMNRVYNGVKGDVLLVITPRNGKYVGAITKYPNQQEVLLEVGSRIRIDRIVTDQNNPLVKIIYVTQL